MASFTINGGKKLSGTVEISGHKNNILPIIAACLLTEEECILHNVPIINDVASMVSILTDLGVKIEGVGTHTLIINSSQVKYPWLNDDLVKKLRASILLMGPLLARFKETKLHHPGGCVIGKRAVDTHFVALEGLGVTIEVNDENYHAKLKKPCCNKIFLDEASVTATET